jgi:hypothetical protein
MFSSLNATFSMDQQGGCQGFCQRECRPYGGPLLPIGVSTIRGGPVRCGADTRAGRILWPEATDEANTFVREAASEYITRLLLSIRHPSERA